MRSIPDYDNVVATDLIAQPVQRSLEDIRGSAWIVSHRPMRLSFDNVLDARNSSILAQFIRLC